MATLAGAVVSFFAGWLLYGMLLADFYAEHAGSASGVMRADEEMVMWALAGGNIFYAYFLVYIFGRWANIRSIGAGFGAGFLLGLIMGIGYSLISYGTSNLQDLTASLVEPLVSAVMMGLTGAAIGWVLGMGSSDNA